MYSSDAKTSANKAKTYLSSDVYWMLQRWRYAKRKSKLCCSDGVVRACKRRAFVVTQSQDPRLQSGATRPVRSVKRRSCELKGQSQSPQHFHMQDHLRQ